jgi:hypothetical protein
LAHADLKNRASALGFFMPNFPEQTCYLIAQA